MHTFGFIEKSGEKNGMPFDESKMTSKRSRNSRRYVQGTAKYTVIALPTRRTRIDSISSCGEPPGKPADSHSTWCPQCAQRRACSKRYASAPPACGCFGSRQLMTKMRRRSRAFNGFVGKKRSYIGSITAKRE